MYFVNHIHKYKVLSQAQHKEWGAVVTAIVCMTHCQIMKGHCHQPQSRNQSRLSQLPARLGCEPFQAAWLMDGWHYSKYTFTFALTWAQLHFPSVQAGWDTTLADQSWVRTHLRMWTSCLKASSVAHPWAQVWTRRSLTPYSANLTQNMVPVLGKWMNMEILFMGTTLAVQNLHLQIWDFINNSNYIVQFTGLFVGFPLSWQRL